MATVHYSDLPYFSSEPIRLFSLKKMSLHYGLEGSLKSTSFSSSALVPQLCRQTPRHAPSSAPWLPSSLQLPLREPLCPNPHPTSSTEFLPQTCCTFLPEAVHRRASSLSCVPPLLEGKLHEDSSISPSRAAVARINESLLQTPWH